MTISARARWQISKAVTASLDGQLTAWDPKMLEGSERRLTTHLTQLLWLGEGSRLNVCHNPAQMYEMFYSNNPVSLFVIFYVCPFEQREFYSLRSLQC